MYGTATADLFMSALCLAGLSVVGIDESLIPLLCSVLQRLPSAYQ